MVTKYGDECFSPKLNFWFLLFLIGLLPVYNAQDPATNYKDRIADAKSKLLKMIQKGIIKKKTIYFLSAKKT